MPKSIISSPPVSSAAVIAALGYTPANVANQKTASGSSDTFWMSQKAVTDALAALAAAATGETVANAAARLALTNKPLNYAVKQADDGFTRLVIDPTQIATEAGWLVTPKRYVALLTQTGTDTPVATVRVNTLGGPVVWTRQGLGNFKANLAEAFTLSKTIATVSGGLMDMNGDPCGERVNIEYDAAEGYVLFATYELTATYDDPNVNLLWDAADWNVVAVTIQIEVYPS